MTNPVFRILRDAMFPPLLRCVTCKAETRYWDEKQAAKWKHAHTAGCPGHQPTDRNPVDSIFDVSPDGDHVTIRVDCGPMTQPHEVRVSFKRLWEIASTCRARQLGVDGRGGL